jgi:hypothetical protein
MSARRARKPLASSPSWSTGTAIWPTLANLSPWNGESQQDELGQNYLGCRPRPGAPWCLDVTIGDGDADAWVYRRDQRRRDTWDIAGLSSADGGPSRAGAAAGLFKSKNHRPKDEIDAAQAITN